MCSAFMESARCIVFRVAGKMSRFKTLEGGGSDMKAFCFWKTGPRFNLGLL